MEKNVQILYDNTIQSNWIVNYISYICSAIEYSNDFSMCFMGNIKIIMWSKVFLLDLILANLVHCIIYSWMSHWFNNSLSSYSRWKCLVDNRYHITVIIWWCINSDSLFVVVLFGLVDTTLGRTGQLPFRYKSPMMTWFLAILYLEMEVQHSCRSVSWFSL